MSYLYFIGLILFLIVVLGVLLGSMDIQNIIAEWPKRRCETAVMFSAFMYKPSTDPRSASAFASDNFSFCMRSLVDEVFKQMLSPVLGVFSQQLGAANTTGEVFNSIRNQIGNTFRSFGGAFNEFFETYKRGTMQLSRITQLLKQAMLKVSAAVVSIVFMGISLMTSLLNTYDFIVQVVIIIMSIIVALIVLLFIVLIPVMPLIFTILAVLTGAGLGGAVAGMRDVFQCIHPDTRVLMADGSMKLLKHVKIGDKLGEGCGTMEGVLHTNTAEILYNVGGIIMSGSHMILDPNTGDPIFAGDFSEATIVTDPQQRPAKLIIPNTSSRLIPLIGDNNKILFAKDWEEIPDDDVEGSTLWETLVWSLLNGADSIPPLEQLGPGDTALFSKDCYVLEEQRGKIPIHLVERGMYVLDICGKSYTEVLCKYKGLCYEGVNGQEGGCDWYSSGVRTLNEDNIWTRQITPHKAEPLAGFNIVTDSGTFMVACNDIVLKVRDFTEVGSKYIDRTYTPIRDHLSWFHKKKEVQQNSNITCASVSSSQA
jgi:hypothetical protein